jgi:hypothetical protein
MRSCAMFERRALLTSSPPAPRRARAALLALLASLALQGCVSPRQAVGEDCLFSDECAQGLVCAHRRCRAVCRDDRDCVNGWQCRRSGRVEGPLACLPPSEPPLCAFSSECPAELACSHEGACIAECAQDRDCASHHPSLRCVERVCRWPAELSDGGADSAR